MTRWLAAVALLATTACVSGAASQGGSTVAGSRDAQIAQRISAGWLGCAPAAIQIGDYEERNYVRVWTASCEGATVVCSFTFSTDVHCAPLRSREASAPTSELARSDSPLVIRDLPPAVAECIERPVPVEVLFGSDGRLSELRPWPGETPEQRRCVERVLVEIDVPTGQGGPVLVRFEPRDPWTAD
ncbi:MAG: hypothetical protein H6721_14540 [Sandaracinus sp.]|nr:hypothetical protein [Sandaracinus sp.]MCB9633334.1 hypothetical protein [Sandaracinus sp.]